MLDIKQLAHTLVNLKVIEVNDLVKILKEEYHIEPATAIPTIPTEAGGLNVTPTEEQIIFSVVLTSPGSSKLPVVKLVKELTGLGLKESKELVDGVPKVLKEGVSKDEAFLLKKQLEEAGAEVEIK